MDKIVQCVLGLREEMAKVNPRLRIFLCMNITGLIQREEVNLANTYFQDVDFIVVHTSKLLGGGLNSANLLLINIKNN